MKNCIECKNKIPATLVIEGKRRNLNNRKRCLDCCPFLSEPICKAANEARRKTPKKQKTCLGCPKIVLARNSKYCGSECFQKTKHNKRNAEIEKTGKFPSASSTISAKKYLREKFGWFCSICKMTEWFGNEMPLVMDHIDGNSDNWNLDNCRLICPNCDTFTPFYKAKNKGNGRFSRRQRFQQGLSF